MLEHSAMYLNVTPPYEEDTSFFPDFYTRISPCELPDPVWAKMSALAAGVKKRKKSETKPQAQINKCNNEKRRREQENIYIEELAELISANFADMSSLSVKPDKCAILQETVNQIRNIKQREAESHSNDPVQQGEVSSSRPTILSNEVYGPLLLEALEGFLFVVNAEGRVEHVTENISTYIKYTREEVLGESIYNFLHHGDHHRFSSSLLPMTIGWSNEPTNRSKSFNIRFLVKEESNESVEAKQQRVSSYESMYISSTLLPDPVSVSGDEDNDNGPCLLCVASRICNRDKTNCTIEQFTTKLDTSGKIICVDTSGVSQNISQYIKKDLMDRVLRDLVPTQEVHKLNAHLRETVSVGSSVSAVYRLQIAPDKFVQVQTKSKFFKTNPQNNTDTDFIMATHSIVSENDAIGPSDPGGGNNSGVGGPLMTSVVNGTGTGNTRNGGGPAGSGSDSSTSSNNLIANNNASFSTFNLDNDFSFDIFPSSTCWELDSGNWSENRPDSRQSVTPVSTPTPRPPSNPSYSPATTVAQSPLAHFVTQQSPSLTNPGTPANPYSSSTFPFSPITDQGYSNSAPEEQKDTKANVLEEASMMVESGRLRNLLTKPPDSGNESDNRNRDRILKELLNQPDEDSARNDNRTSPRAGGSILPRAVPTAMDVPKSSSSNGNDMLRKLLNDKSDDDDLEAKTGIKKKSELLQQLLKPETRDDDEKKSEHQSQDDTLLRSLGFEPSSNGEPGRARKRPSDDRDDNPSKRSTDGSQVSSSGPSTGSKLYEKNKMLAKLLAQQPTNHQPIPHQPASVISALPQEKLPRITDPNLNKNIQMGLMNQSIQQSLMNNVRARMPGRPPNAQNYLSSIQNVNNIQRNDNRQINQVNSSCYTSPATSSTDNNNTGWENNNIQYSDRALSDILDQVIDIVPDNIMNNIMDQDGQQNNFHQSGMSAGLSESMAITMIQKDLMMQCENVVKSPSSPTISMPGTPPAYSQTNITTQNNQTGAFQPPPNYSRQALSKHMPGRPGQQYTNNIAASQQQQHLILQQRQKLAMEQKRRLLQLQQQQKVLIPSNVTSDQMNPNMSNIDSLLNNTVAPNVSLQRSTSAPESQLSPNYAGQLNQQSQRLGNQPPYSPHSQLTSPIGQQAGFPQTTVGNYVQPGARLSPPSQFNQLSPRQAYPQGNAQNPNWPQQQQRISVQQTNPMLNAQLTGNYIGSRNFQRAPQQPQRGINSPGAVPTRHSPFPPDQFPPPSSPNSAYQQNQYLRMQRTNSAPTATTQLPGGLGSPRPYTGREHHPHPYPQLPPTHHPMMYQQDSSQYCYDQSGLQLPYNGADRGRAPSHLQTGVSGGGGPTTSEFVRQELRAVVGARTQQAQPPANRPAPQNMLNNPQQVADLDALGINFEMPPGGSDNQNWGAMGSDMGSMSPQPATSRTTMEELRQGDHKSSLLQKLLSE